MQRKRRRAAAIRQQRAWKRARAVHIRTFGRFAGPSQELKFHDLDIDDASITINGSIIEPSCLTIPQGTTESERIGRRVTVKNIHWKYNITFPAIATASAPEALTVRVIVYLDKQTNGAAATITGILETDNYQSFNNLSNTSRFRILMDRVHTIRVSGGAGDGAANDFAGLALNAEWHKSCNIPIEYDNSFTTGVITTMRSNNIGVLLLGKGTAGVFDSKMRIRFSDV